MKVAFVLATMLWLAACHEATPAARSSDAAAHPARDLVLTENGLGPLAGDDSPRVELVGTSVRLDGEPAGDVTAAARGLRPQRIDALFAKLRGMRATWQTMHPGSSLPGRVRLHFPPTAIEAVVLSVAQTAALADYPCGSFAVRRADASPGRLPLETIVPTADAPPLEPDLDVRVSSDRVSVTWRDGARERTSLAALASTLRASWEKRGAPCGQTAVLFFEPDATFDTMMRVADAVAGPKCERGGAAFATALGAARP